MVRYGAVRYGTVWYGMVRWYVAYCTTYFPATACYCLPLPARYDAMVADITVAEREAEERRDSILPSARLQLTFGAHVIVAMGTMYAFAYYATKMWLGFNDTWVSRGGGGGVRLSRGGEGCTCVSRGGGGGRVGE